MADIDLSKLSTEDLVALKSGDLTKVSDAGLMAMRGAPADIAPKQNPGATGARIVQEALYRGAANLPDMVLNTPNTLLNLGKAGVGAAATALGRPDMAPQLTPNPDFARRGLQAVGLIDPNIQPQGGFQKGLDTLTQGAVGGALTGGASLPRVAIGAGMGALSAGAAGATEAVTGNTALAATAGMLPAARGAFANPRRDATLKSQDSIKNETWTRAREAGYVVPPSAIEPTFIGNRLEGIGGKAALGQEVAIRNQAVTNKIARAEAGLAHDAPISEGTLAAARETMLTPYKEVAALSPLAAKALDGVKQARAESKLKWAEYNRQQTVSSLREAQALDNKASMYETAIDKIASRQGSPELLQQLREARVALAKNYDVERAVNVGSGDVDAHVIGRMLDKGKPLSDGLETIGRFANGFSKSFSRDAANVPTPGVSKLEALAAVGLGMGGHASGLGWLPMGLPLISGPARSLALSPAMLGQKQYGPGLLSEVAGRTSPIATSGTLAELLQQRNQ